VTGGGEKLLALKKVQIGQAEDAVTGDWISAIVNCRGLLWG